MMDKLPDATGRHILRLLQADARISYAEIGRRVHLSTPAVIERVEKMQAAGLITGYHAAINSQALGYAVSAIVTLTTEPHHYPIVYQIVAESDAIETCDHVTGAASFVMRVSAPSIAHLEAVIGQFTAIGTTQTAIIMSSADTSGTIPRRIQPGGDG